MAELQSYKLDMEAVIKVKTEEMTLEIPITSTGHFQAPDRSHMTTSGNLMGFLDLGSETIQIGDKQYEKASGETEWTVSEEPDDISRLYEIFLSVPSAIQPVLEEINGVSVYYINWETSGGSEVSAAMAFLGATDPEDFPEGSTWKLEIRIDADSFYVREFILSVGAEEIMGEDEGTGEGSITMKFTFSAFNEDFPPIVAPKALAAPAPAPL